MHSIQHYFKKQPKPTLEERLAYAQHMAGQYAKQWKEDCYVYVRDGGELIIYSAGPDLDHPKTEPTMVISIKKR